jgi:hypothetical protein
MTIRTSTLSSTTKPRRAWLAPLALVATFALCATQQGCVCLCMVQEGGCGPDPFSASSEGGSSATSEGGSSASESSGGGGAGGTASPTPGTGGSTETPTASGAGGVGGGGTGAAGGIGGH